MKIYVASSWRNVYQPALVRTLMDWGAEVYDFRHPEKQPLNLPAAGFHWSEIDPKWQSWTTDQYITALDHQRAEQGFAADFKAMEWADLCVLVLPCGRSAHLELGWFVGKGKPTAIYCPEPERMEPELMVKMCDLVTGDLHGLTDWLGLVEHELSAD